MLELPTSRRQRRILRRAVQNALLPALLLAATHPAVVSAAEPGGAIEYPTNDEEWYVIKLGDARCGYMYSNTRRVGDEIHTRVLMKFGISRGDAKVDIAVEQAYRETLKGRPLALRFESSMAQMPVVQTATIDGDQLTLVTEQMGVERKQTYEFDPDVKFPWGQLLEQRERGLKPGTEFTIKSYEPSIRPEGAVEMNIKVYGKEKTKVLGKTQELYRVGSTMRLSDQMSIESVSWVDDDAIPVVASVDFGMMTIKMFRSTKEDALAEVDDAPELFLNTFIAADRLVPEDAGAVTYRLRVPSDRGGRLPDLPDTAMQRFKRVSDTEGVLTVKRIDWETVRAASDPVNGDPSLAPYLRASTVLDINDKTVRRLARRGARKAETPAEKADALRKYVTRYVTEKSLDVGFGTASEVARTKCGDCTEHGVLLAALARSAGLPARGVSGLVQIPPGPLSPKDHSAFGYHMWTQVYIGGRWVDIDAAMRQTDCDPTHIALAVMPLNDEGLLDSVLSLIPLLGRLEIQVVTVTP